METLDDDVVLSSYPKAGTTWIHNILYCLLRMDESGAFMHERADDLGGNSQIYPDAVPLEPPSQATRRFGSASFNGIQQQPRPRLFSTHMREGMLPTALEGRGRLVYMMRNPKDTLTSLHFFLQKVAELTPKEYRKAEFTKGLVEEGWLGSGDGQTGSYHRFNAWPEESNYWWCGSYYGHVRGMSALLGALGDRAAVVYYERLQEDLAGELRRLGGFLGVPMSDAKVEAIVKHVSKDSMASRLQSYGRGALVRKGVVGDHAHHLTDEHWKQMDLWFAERLQGVEIAAPLVKYMAP
uniref:Sulfotransferase domain-containing protein n=1 Tax=Alexandrium catenella TaxID=2925 RepID=A0A7S1S438_ALECA